MIAYTVKIANCVIRIENIHPQCRLLCKDFITDDHPLFCINTNQDDIDIERPLYEKINGECNNDGVIEIQAVFHKLTERMIDYGTFMLHGAAIAVNGSAYIFTGNSGIGKTTHILKWLRNLSNTQEINGDKPFITIGETPLVYGSPWAGKERLYTNSSFPLKSIVLLNRAESNQIERKSLIDIYPALCQQIIRTKDIVRTRKLLQMLGSLNSTVSFYQFNVNNFKDDCFDIAYYTLMRNC